MLPVYSWSVLSYYVVALLICLAKFNQDWGCVFFFSLFKSKLHICLVMNGWLTNFDIFLNQTSHLKTKLCKWNDVLAFSLLQLNHVYKENKLMYT